MPREQTSSPNLWAMLIGIDTYKTQPGLRGCVNDVQAMRIFLMNHYNVPDEHIHVLINEEATRGAILQEFQEFLINNRDIQPDDQILFHYSGHGSQMPTRPGEFEPDGLNETIVPYDSRTTGIFDIPDKTLAELLNKLAAAKREQITVIFDSCHSGSITRELEFPSAPRVRRVAPDNRIPPADLDANLWNRSRDVRRTRGPSGWSAATIPYVLLAGCQDRQSSHEIMGKIENAHVWHGALTFFMLQVLQELPSGASYADLYEQLAPLVNAHFSDQMPQCEGKRERVIFGNAEKREEPFITVQKVSTDGKSLTLEAGLVHGLRPGTELALYPSEVRTIATLPSAPFATIRVTSVEATTAIATVIDAPTQPIPPHARGVITQQAYAGLQQTVRLESTNDSTHVAAIGSLLQAIDHATVDGGPSPYLKIEDDPQSPVDLHVKVEAGQFSIYDDDHVLLVEPVPIQPHGLAADDEIPSVILRRALESIARYRTIVSLRNAAPQSKLAGKVKLHLHRYVQDETGPHVEELPSETMGPGGELTLYFDPDHEERNLYVVDVINESKLNVYPHIFTLSSDYSISLLYPPEGVEEAVTPGSTYPIGLQAGTSQLSIWLPPGWDASRDCLKAIVTTQPADLRLLEQQALDVPAPPAQRDALKGPEPAIEGLLKAVAFGEGTRLLRPTNSPIAEDWSVTQLAIDTLRQYQTTRLDPPQARIPLSEEVILIKPEGFTGSVSVTSVGLATRGDSGDPNLKFPPGLAHFPHLFEPVGRSSTRSIGENGLVIAFTVDEVSRQLVTSDHPLRLELPTMQNEDVADLMPVAFDGEDYLLVGYGTQDKKAVHVVSLPALTPAPEDQPARRDLGRTIRLFIYKKMGRFTNLVGLHRAELKNGEVVYSDVQRDQFKPGQQVAVFVHGFSSDTRWMVKQPAQFLCEQVQAYDHLLAWDYETFGTSIQETGDQFALALKQQCGFGPGDGITVDVYAHSMGTLVTRSMVELSGGFEFVDRGVLAGPPNQGTTLASTGRGIVFLITAMLNNASLVPVLGAANWALRQLYEQGLGVADLAVDAPLLKKINALDTPSNVPYLVLAGVNKLNVNEKKFFNRIAHKVLDKELDIFFGEVNDAVIGQSSMKGLRGGAYPQLTVEILPCDHFNYFDTPEGQQAIKQWMARFSASAEEPTHL